VTDTHDSRWDRWRIGYNATAAAAAALLTPYWLRVLHVAGDYYGGALFLIALAAWLDHRADRWLTRVLLITSVLAALLDTLVVAGLLAWTMGVTW
jgi:hypothetical protein